MEKLIDWEKMKKSVKKIISYFPGYDTNSIIREIEVDYEKPEYVPLCEKIWEAANTWCNTKDFGIVITKEQLNEAVKDIDYPCKKVHFPKATKGMVGFLNSYWTNRYNRIKTLEAFRQDCKEGKYEKTSEAE